MAQIRTYLDTNILIHAFRGFGPIADSARTIVDDSSRDFIASDILRLELIPKPRFFGRIAEVQFYEHYFASAIECVPCTPMLVRSAESEAAISGLSAADALHVVAAISATAQEFVTAERKTSPLFRVSSISLTSLWP